MTLINQCNLGDCLEVMRGMPENSVDSIVTDPPYGLSFMGKKWDYDVPSTGIWAECLRVLKPGGHLLAFAGTRTQHRMAVRIEDAGFEIRDMIAWVYSSGFPKSHNLDNHRGKAFCGCEQTTKRDMRPLRDGDVPKAQLVDQERGEILQQIVPQQGAQSAMQWAEPKEGAQGGSELSMEGRGYAIQEEWELQKHSVFESATLGKTNGTQGWVSDGTPSCDGSVVRIPSDANGSGSSRRPQPTSQRADESGAMAGQSKPQAVGTRAICGGCGLPVVPRGLGTALKPALEPITMARKPLGGTVAANVLQHGTGALNIEACRVDGKSTTRVRVGGRGTFPHEDDSWVPKVVTVGSDDGRWPANLIHDGSPEVLSCFPTTTSGTGAVKRASSADSHGNTGAAYGAESRPDGTPMVCYGDTGSAARFFYCAKASKEDRNDGCHGMQEMQYSHDGRETPIDNAYQRNSSNSSNSHPTVKPTDLMRYLCRLVTPIGGIILDPFMGSGSTGRGAVLEGFRFIGIEREAQYFEIAKARISSAERQGHQPNLFAEAA